MKVLIQTNEGTFNLELEDNPTTRSFFETLPLTVKLDDYAGIEKVFYPDPKLSIEAAPLGANPLAGDVMYYSPWGDVAIFYKSFSYAPGLIPMGKIGDIDRFVSVVDRFPEVTFSKE